ncbi:MAG: hypothetical protein HY520_04900 [Candidatus Aenigmarchaeota archaeon]|nr:hypothetical protein [Candidatus Aenigmarchaeota archaeon]
MAAAKKQKKPKKDILDKFADVLEQTADALKGRKVAAGAVVAAAIGGLLKLTEVTRTFPPPADLMGNLIIFFAVLFFVADLAKGGLYD